MDLSQLEMLSVSFSDVVSLDGCDISEVFGRIASPNLVGRDSDALPDDSTCSNHGTLLNDSSSANLCAGSHDCSVFDDAGVQSGIFR